MLRKINIIKSTDWLTVSIYLLLVIIGWINIYAAVYNEEHKSIFDITQSYGKQLIWISTSLIIALGIFVIDSKLYSIFAFVIYGIIMGILLAVLIFGKEVHGARSWFEIGDFRLQPSEFAKFATCLGLAKYMSSPGVKLFSLESILIKFLIIGLPGFLIALQPDMGSVLVYTAFIIIIYREGLPDIFMLLGILFIVLFIAPIKTELHWIILSLYILSIISFWAYRKNIRETIIISAIIFVVWGVLYIINELFLSPQFDAISIGIILSAIVLPVFIFWAYKLKIYYSHAIIGILVGSMLYVFSVNYILNNVLEPHQQSRINALLGEKDKVDLRKEGYNVHQSLIAIGSGGVLGKGFLQGTQTKYNFVPEQSTDFIFCTIGEEWGYIGSIVVMLLFLFLLLRLIFLAERQRSKFSRIYGYGVSAILFFHVAINIGMTIGLAPVIGIPLPFFSYGGSSLWAFTILLFIFLRLDASRIELL